MASTSKRCYIDDEFARLSDSHRDQIYRDIFKSTKIWRSRWNDKNPIDIYDHIDVVLDDKITLQEKVLRYEHTHYNTFTIEFKQDRFKNIDGEFYHIKANYYMHGYANEDGTKYTKYCILKVKELIDFLKYNYCWRLINDNNSRANFLAIEYNKIPDDCYYYKYNI